MGDAPKTILIVDDSSTVREKIRDLLIQKGHTVISAGDGKEGILRFQENPKIDLIISDVTMPDVDGIAMIEAIKTIVGVKMPPVLMLTAITLDKDSKAKAKALGVRAWILKPFDEARLVEALDHFLK